MPDEKPDDKTLKALHAAISQLEYVLAQIGDNLLFLVKPDGGLEIVRRTRDGQPTEPKEVVVRLRGADPLLWQAERPEGDLTLGLSYRDPAPRCVFTGRSLPSCSPVDLYFRGQPVDVKHAFAISPRLTLVHGMVTTLNALLYELWKLMSRISEVEGGDQTTEEQWSGLVTRVRDMFRDLEEAEFSPEPKPGDIPEEN